VCGKFPHELSSLSGEEELFLACAISKAYPRWKSL